MIQIAKKERKKTDNPREGWAEEREKNIVWIRRMFTAWRVSHAERREEREAAGEDDNEEDDTPVVIHRRQLSRHTRGELQCRRRL